MKKASVTDAKNRLSAILSQVKEGETYLILERGQPVARIEPVRSGEGNDAERSADLERRGLMRRGRGNIRKQLVETGPPSLPGNVSGVGALIDERRRGR